jgi:molybdate-binding protein/DNA-binding transcriptional regulator YhcF (GntR family)
MQKTSTYLYEDIAASLRQKIASGELTSGDKLPAVRELSAQWGCTPGTVSRAYAVLADEGLVSGHRGGGTRVTSPDPQAGQPSWQWAALINKADQYLLEALRTGHSPAQAEAALAVAIARWSALQRDATSASSVNDASASSVNDASAGALPGVYPSTATTTLRFAGSHDLLIEFVARLWHELSPEIQLQVDYVGSLSGLIALAQHEADIAGSHLWDGDSQEYNQPFVRRILPGRSVILLGLALRDLGLVIPAGNPQQIIGLQDLARDDVQFINRQSGAGTRVWLDKQLQQANIDPTTINGYAQEKKTHLQVAQAVVEGSATVGLAIQAAGAAYGLDFIPLTQERYDLVIPAELWGTPALRTLVDLVHSDRFREAVSALDGYEPIADIGVETIT